MGGSITFETGNGFRGLFVAYADSQRYVWQYFYQGDGTAEMNSSQSALTFSFSNNVCTVSNADTLRTYKYLLISYI